jgi:RimJ/RimL family protein N-acetyltransferase
MTDFIVTYAVPMDVAPDIHPLEGRHVRLEALEARHIPGLLEVGTPGPETAAEIFRYMPHTFRTPEALAASLQTLLRERADGTSLAFATIDRLTNRPVGSTRFMAIDRANRHLEIGGTWIAPAWQRTAINTEAKLLMLGHAFEGYGCIRVEFKTDSLNVRSREAILRLGAKEEGTFRNHMIVDGGRLRHSVYFSITHQEWPAIKAGLQAKLAR